MWRQLLAERPDDPRSLGAIAFIHDKLDRTAEARELWRTLVDRFPTKSPYWISYGLNLRAAGLTEEAVSALRRAVTVDPERGEAWWGLASIKSYTISDEDIVTMKEALETATDVVNLSPLHFALGRAFQGRKQHEAAFHHFSEANRLWAEAIKYNAEELTKEVAEARTTFDRGYFNRLEPDGASSDAPVFLVSLPRSGSTLLEQMLGTHPDIEPLGELPYIPALMRSVMERATQRKRVTVPQVLAEFSPADRKALGEEYLRRAAVHRRSDSSRFIDKLPHNWNNILFIKHILPNARFIDIRRTPVACCFANFSHSFTRAHSSSFSLDHIGRAYRDYLRLMEHLDEAAPGMVHHLRYEELIDQPEDNLRRVLDYLALPWDDSVLRFYEADRAVRTPSAEQVRRPLNREGIGAWKPYRQWLGPLIEALGPLADQELAEADRA
ncbi:MAG TPA: sulfotransferase [Sphingomicrobium sp.]|nr:sulfotransferase [Sphingomicrobium sp.]